MMNFSGLSWSSSMRGARYFRLYLETSISRSPFPAYSLRMALTVEDFPVPLSP